MVVLAVPVLVIHYRLSIGIFYEGERNRSVYVYPLVARIDPDHHKVVALVGYAWLLYCGGDGPCTPSSVIKEPGNAPNPPVV